MGTIISLFLAGFSGLCTYGFVRENGGSEAQAQGAGVIVAIIVLLLLFLFWRWLKSPGGSAEPKAGNRRGGNGRGGGGDDGSPSPVGGPNDYTYLDYAYQSELYNSQPQPQHHTARPKQAEWADPQYITYPEPKHEPEPKHQPTPQRTEPAYVPKTQPEPERVSVPNWPKPNHAPIPVPNWPTRETGGNIHKEHPEWFE